VNALTLRRLRRIRWVVRLTLATGVAASVAANILHARPHPVSQAIAAWPPLALLLTVELVSRVPVTRRSLSVLRVLATGVISGIAAWVSYWHMAGVASRYGETDASPYLLPVSVDGLIVVASISLVELAARIRSHEDATPSTMASPVMRPEAEDGPGPVPTIVPDGIDQVVDDELLTLARQAATGHRRQTGRDITRDQLRAALRISNATAGELLHHIRATGPALPARSNHTVATIGELTR